MRKLCVLFICTGRFRRRAVAGYCFPSNVRSRLGLVAAKANVIARKVVHKYNFKVIITGQRCGKYILLMNFRSGLWI